MPPSLTVTAAAEHAIDELRALYAELRRHQVAASPSRMGLASTPDDVAWARRRAFYLRIRCFVVRAYASERLAGYAVAGTQDGFASWGPDAPVGVVHDLIVAEAARRQGIGTLLLDQVRVELRASRAVALRINLVSGNAAALAFYSHQGLEAIAQTLAVAIG